MKKIELYIGSNNLTHRLEKHKAISILGKYFDGMSLSEIIGFWKGQQEKTLQVSIVSDTVDEALIETVCKELNTKLNQDAIMVEITDTNTQFISSR